MGKFREMGERVYEMREVTMSVNFMRFGIGNFITGYGFWEPRKMSSLGLRFSGEKGLRKGGYDSRCFGKGQL